MLSSQLKLVRQRRRLKTVQWKDRLDRHLRCYGEAKDIGQHLIHSVLLSFTYVSHLLATAISAVPEAVCQTSLPSVNVIAAMTALAIQTAILCGALGREPDPLPACQKYNSYLSS